MPCQIEFATRRREYITNPHQYNCEGMLLVFKYLRDCGGLLTTKERQGFTDIFRFYVKWYNIFEYKEYSSLNDYELLEFKFSLYSLLSSNENLNSKSS